MLTVQDAKRFTNNIDFITSPGYLTEEIHAMKRASPREQDPTGS